MVVETFLIVYYAVLVSYQYHISVFENMGVVASRAPLVKNLRNHYCVACMQSVVSSSKPLDVLSNCSDFLSITFPLLCTLPLYLDP